jgi:selenoprotein W-related protein
VELVSSSGGVFEVVVDNELVFSKKNLRRFPEEGEITLLLQAGRR